MAVNKKVVLTMGEPYWEVLYDWEPGHCALNKTFSIGEDGKQAAKEKAEKEAERLKDIGYYIYDIQYRNPAIWLNEEIYELEDEEEEEEEE